MDPASFWPSYCFLCLGRLLKKVHQLGLNLPPKRTLELVQPSFANVHLIKAKLWGNVNGKAYGLSSITY